MMKFNGLVKSQKSPFSVIPAKLVPAQAESGNPGSDIFSGHPQEFTPAKAEAGVTVVTLGQIPHSLRGSSLRKWLWVQLGCR